MNRLSIVKRIGDLSEEHCQSCEIQAQARKERPTRKAEDYCQGCKVYAELRTLGNHLLDITGAERKQKEQSKSKGMEKVAKAKLEMTVDEFVSLREAGHSIMKIAKMKGVADPTIHYWKNKNAEAIQKALGQTETKSEGETTKLVKQTLETAGERKYEVLQAAIKQLETQKADWQERAEKAEKELSKRDDDKEAIRQANIQLVTENKSLKTQIDELHSAGVAAENEKADMTAQLRKNGEALRMVRDENALAHKQMERLDHRLENLARNFKEVRDELDQATAENRHLRGLVEIYLPKVSC